MMPPISGQRPLAIWPQRTDRFEGSRGGMTDSSPYSKGRFLRATGKGRPGARARTAPIGQAVYAVSAFVSGPLVPPTAGTGRQERRAQLRLTLTL